MPNFDAKTDVRATTMDTADVLAFGDVSADGWETITFANFLPALQIETLTADDLAPVTFATAFSTITKLVNAEDITPVATGTLISQWNDSGGSGNHFTQVTGANQPNYRAA